MKLPATLALPAAADAPMGARLAFGAAVLLAFVIPLGIAATNLLALVLLATWLAQPQRAARAAAALREPVVQAALALWALLLLGTLWSPAGPLSDEALRHAFGYRKLLLIPLVASVCDTRPRRLWVLGAFIAGAGVAALTTLAALLLNQAGIEWTKHGVPFTWKNHINESFVAVLAMYACATLAATGAQRRLRLALAALALLFGLHVVIALPGRTGYVILFALLLLLALQMRLRPRALAAALAAFTVMAAAAWSSDTFRARLNSAVGEVAAYSTQGAATSLGLRMEFWRNGLRLAAQAPVFGHGTGAVPLLYRDLPRADTAAGRVWTGNLHNQYLQFAVDLGAVGVVAFAGFLAVAGWRVRQLPVPERLLAAGVLLAFAIGCLFNSFLLDATEGHAVPALLGVLLGGLQGSLRGDENRAETPR